MTQDETEFAVLLTKYNHAQTAHKVLELNKPSKPEYEADSSGYISVGTIAAYKAALTTYEEYQQGIKEAATALQGAQAELEAYFPDEIKAAFGRGVAMFAPVPGGIIGLLKEGNSYTTFTGRDRSDAQSKLSYHLQLQQARRK